MTFREWLPITKRNQIALILAGTALALFATWNFLPYYDMAGQPSEGIAATAIWPEVFDPDIYIYVFRSPDIDGFLEVMAYNALLLSGLSILLTVPLWILLHASSYVRIPLALLNLLGGSVITWHLFDSVLPDPEPYWIETVTLMALSMFAISAAFFLFKNELALREERGRGKVR